MCWGIWDEPCHGLNSPFFAGDENVAQLEPKLLNGDSHYDSDPVSSIRCDTLATCHNVSITVCHNVSYLWMHRKATRKPRSFCPFWSRQRLLWKCFLRMWHPSANNSLLKPSHHLTSAACAYSRLRLYQYGIHKKMSNDFFIDTLWHTGVAARQSQEQQWEPCNKTPIAPKASKEE